MHILLYIIAVTSTLIALAVGVTTSNLAIISNGLLAGVLFGAIAKIIHLLVQIEEHLRPAPDPDKAAEVAGPPDASA